MSEASDQNLTIQLNGKPRAISPGWSISDLVHSLNLVDKMVVAERNGEIVPRSVFPETELADGDVLELVHFVGGGSGLRQG